jgi:phospho-2-dehydro-3-deoxyheptonate aldolase
MIDFSHANSSKQYKRQMDVAKDVANQVAGGSRCIIGAMVESHLVEGKQDLVPGKALAFGQSITDPCIGWEDSVRRTPLQHGCQQPMLKKEPQHFARRVRPAGVGVWP